MAPPIAVEDITSATAFTEGHPTVVGLFPSGEKPTVFQQRVGRFAIDTSGDRRIHGLTISTVFADGEVTNVPLLWATRASRGPSWPATGVRNSAPGGGVAAQLAVECGCDRTGSRCSLLASALDTAIADGSAVTDALNVAAANCGRYRRPGPDRCRPSTKPRTACHQHWPGNTPNSLVA